MKYLLLALSFYLTACKSTVPIVEMSPSLNIEKIDEFIFASSIRAIQVVDEKTVWWAGSNGLIGHTDNGGQSWETDTLSYQGKPLHFRSISVTPSAVFVLSIESPALLFKSIDKGRNWRLVYQEDHAAAFYDAMQFWNPKEGIAMGDPTDGCISIIITRDGGNSWQKLPCAQLPSAAEGEAAFAASNSNIALKGDHAWVVTGGAKARILHSPDKGKTWTITQSPIKEGGQMTGIYSVDFWDTSRGIVFGGDWNQQTDNLQNKATTTDGGKSWQLTANGASPGYRSSVKYFPNGKGQAIIAVGIPGISVSRDAGNSWRDLSTESWYAASFVPGKNTCWLAGNKKIGKVAWR
ncbi:WD40/YVTN/BNR-like repeat-containing protein [Neolewinella persica]|uniref:WD40/YVTN/BNR-like repeat-containing protein n=1 Tax=Neolewinella persica TaxID=70998 RepID=UPI00037B7816|nr:YCF48-related protein [Neolewinella persica]